MISTERLEKLFARLTEEMRQERANKNWSLAAHLYARRTQVEFLLHESRTNDEQAEAA